MSDITISDTTKTDNGWTFNVRVDKHAYRVTLTKDYYQQLTHNQTTPELLIEASFRFLLEREEATSIMKEFDLPAINKYFPEYETEIRNRLQ